LPFLECGAREVGVRIAQSPFLIFDFMRIAEWRQHNAVLKQDDLGNSSGDYNIR